MNFCVSLPQGSYEQTKAAAMEVERLGYDTIYISDHLVPTPAVPYEYGIYEKYCYLDIPRLECWTVLSALSVETEEVKLGTFTLCNSFRHPPPLIAKMASTVDRICEGRLIFGIGTGYNEPEYVMYGVPFPKPLVRIRQLEEAIQIIKKMWTEDNPTFDGEYYRIKEAMCNPRPVQKPHPPILIGGRRRLMLKTVAKYADIWNWPPSVPCPPRRFEKSVETINKHCKTVGRDPENIIKSLGTHSLIAENCSDLKKEVQKHKPREVSTETYMKYLVGTPDQCIEKINKYRDIGVGEFVLSFPGISNGNFHYLELFAEKVIPSL